MKREELVDRIARAIAHMEGFYLTQEDAEKRGLRWPTVAQRNCNPGNVRRWANRAGIEYPRRDGYVDFLAWARLRNPDLPPEQLRDEALAEGWRVLRTLVDQYVQGRYHSGTSPTLYEMFSVYAPASDDNHPRQYAEFVARRVKIRPDVPLREVIDG
jgi:hypothetical protein